LPKQVSAGMKVAALCCGCWSRAEVIGKVNTKGNVRLRFVDYGTVGYAPLKDCRVLMEQFSTLPNKAIRGSLYGIEPKDGTALWDHQLVQQFIDTVRDKVHRIKIMKHHEHVNNLTPTSDYRLIK
jgi:Tudor domain